MEQLRMLIAPELRPEKDYWIWPYYSLVVHTDGTIEWSPEMIEESEARMMVTEFLHNRKHGKMMVN